MAATATTYPALPTLAGRSAIETAYDYGVRVLAFVVAEDVTATLDTEALEQALHASTTIVAAREMAPQAMERIQLIRARIAGTIRTRRAAEQVAVKAEAMKPKPAPKSMPGARVPVRRPSPVMPPSGVANPF